MICKDCIHWGGWFCKYEEGKQPENNKCINYERES